MGEREATNLGRGREKTDQGRKWEVQEEEVERDPGPEAGGQVTLIR